MLVLPAGFRIFVATEPVDMRKQANGLWAVAERIRPAGCPLPDHHASSMMTGFWSGSFIMLEA